MRGATHRLPGLALTDHGFELPLDHDRPDGERVQVFAREAVAIERAGDDLPWLVFFQGGPGFGAPPAEVGSGRALAGKPAERKQRAQRASEALPEAGGRRFVHVVDAA